MVTRIFNKAIIALSAVLTLGLSACSGCSSHQWSSSESTISSIPSSEESEFESSSQRLKKYKIVWQNYDGNVLYSNKVLEGETPVYEGETPVRNDTPGYIFTWTGWTPEVVPAHKNATYIATFSGELETYTVTFANKDGHCSYSQDKIENVPYNSQITYQDESITINGVTVTVSCTTTEEERNYNEYFFNGWEGIENYSYVTHDMTINALYSSYPKVYDIEFVIEGGGGDLICYASNGDVIHGGVTVCNTKGYGGHVVGGVDGEPVTDKDIYFTTVDPEHPLLHMEAVDVQDDLGSYSFVGWYINGEIMRYGQEYYGQILVNVRFERVFKDYTDIFTYEIDPIRMEAIIVGLDNNVYHHETITTLVLPRTYNGYTVAGIKGQVLWDIYGYEYPYTLYIPNTFVFFEELTYTIPALAGKIRRVILEEGNPHFNYVDGILYNGDMTQLFTGTDEMYGFMSNNHLNIPDSVTYIWAHAFAGRTLDSVSLPSGLSKVSVYCFDESHLKTITIPNSVTTIDMSAFYGCDFETLNIPDSVTTIESSAFADNPYLKYVHIGAGLEELNSAFYKNQGLLSYDVDSRNTCFKTYNGALYDYSLTQLISYPAGQTDDFGSCFPAGVTNIPYLSCRECLFETIYIPEGIETIESHGIYNFEYLEEIHLPSTITRLSGACFFWCWNVTRFYYNGTMEQWEAIEKPHYDGGWKVTLNKLDKVICLDGEVAV